MNNSFNNEGFNNKSKSKKFGIIIGIVLILLIAAIIVFVVLSRKNNSTNITNTTDNIYDSKNENSMNLSYKTYSESNETNNISIPFQTVDGYYVINLKGENIGKPLQMSYSKVNDSNSYTFENESIKISHFYNVSIGGVTIHNLWGYDYIKISVDDNMGVPTTSEYTEYSVIDNNGYYYLMSATSNGTTNYYIYIINEAQDYRFNIYATDTTNLEHVRELYNKLLENSELCFMKFDSEDNFKEATKEKTSTETVDTSNWTFLPDLILKYFKDRGIHLTNSIEIYNFNHNGNGEVFTYQIYSMNDKLYQVGFTINEIDKDKYESITDEEKREDSFLNLYEGIKEIDLNAFEETFVYSSSKEANLFVKSGDNYYSIETGITYNYKSNNAELTENVINICNQIFY